jgi:hypothetical protein
MEQSEIDLVRRALALRKARSIGVLWAEDGRYSISANGFDLYGSRERLSVMSFCDGFDADDQRLIPRQIKGFIGDDDLAIKMCVDRRHGSRPCSFSMPGTMEAVRQRPGKSWRTTWGIYFRGFPTT